MAFGTLNLILSTVLSITFIPCCKIVLMFYNVSQLNAVGDLEHGILNLKIK